MTSSLVGSEMCIRDRSIGRAGSSSGQMWPPGNCLGTWTSPTTSVAHCRRCLLYTSDAADDM
eukprot:9362874-Prorocentrum_lima.AAC.1